MRQKIDIKKMIGQHSVNFELEAIGNNNRNLADSRDRSAEFLPKGLNAERNDFD